MPAIDDDWEIYLRRLRSEMLSQQDALARWRSSVVDAVDSYEAAEKAEEASAEERAEDSPLEPAIPPDAPQELRTVVARAERGELELLDVFEGESSDPDVRKVHLWLASRLDIARTAFGVLSPDMTPEQADSAVRAALGRGEGSAASSGDSGKEHG